MARAEPVHRSPSGPLPSRLDSRPFQPSPGGCRRGAPSSSPPALSREPVEVAKQLADSSRRRTPRDRTRRRPTRSARRARGRPDRRGRQQPLIAGGTAAILGRAGAGAIQAVSARRRRRPLADLDPVLPAVTEVVLVAELIGLRSDVPESCHLLVAQLAREVLDVAVDQPGRRGTGAGARPASPSRSAARRARPATSSTPGRRCAARPAAPPRSA